VASYQRGVSFVVDDGYEDRARWPGTGRGGAGRRQQSSKAAKQQSSIARLWLGLDCSTSRSGDLSSIARLRAIRQRYRQRF
jgi:hypothetical protein